MGQARHRSNDAGRCQGSYRDVHPTGTWQEDSSTLQPSDSELDPTLQAKGDEQPPEDQQDQMEVKRKSAVPSIDKPSFTPG